MVHLNGVGCPGDVDLGPNEAFLRVLGRGYPRAAPGRIAELASDPGTGALVVVAGGAPVGDEVVVWTPTSGDGHETTVDGLEELVAHDVDGGRILTATTAAADWRLEVVPAAG